jgi:hypothetical protein
MRNSLGLRNSLVAAAFIAAVFMLGASTDQAAAMMGASPAQLGVSDADNGLVQKAALVCNRWGCRRTWAGRRVLWGHRVAWGRGYAWRHRVAWGPRRVWLGPRPLYAYAGPSVAVGWGGGPGWGWSGGPGFAWSGLGWGGWGGSGWGGAGWSGWSSPAWAFGGGWGGGWGGWRRPWGWNSW